MGNANTVEFKITVSGATEGVREVERMHTALEGVTLSLDRYLASQLVAEKQMAQPPAAWATGISAAAGLEKAGVVPDPARVEVLTKAYNDAKSAIQGATAASGLWAKGISDAAKAAASGVQPHSNLAAAFGRTGAASQQFGSSLRQQHQELFEGARLVRSFADAFAMAFPGLSTFTGAITRLSRETSGFTGGMVAMTAGVLGVALVLGHFIQQATELITVQAAANKAVAGMNFSAAEAGFAGVTDKVRELTVAQKTWADLTLRTEGMGGLAALFVKLKAAATDLTGQTRAWADAMDETWQSFGRGQAILDVTLADLNAQNKALDNAAAHAGSIGELADVYAQQEVAIRKAAQATLDKKILDDDAFEAAKLNAIAEASDYITQAQLEKLLDDLGEQMAARKKQRAAEGRADDEADIARKDADAKKLAALNAQEISDVGKLIAIRGQVAMETLRSSQSEIDARHAVAKADADFFGTSLQGLAQYQAARRASIIAEGAVELAALEAVQAKERAAQVVKIGGLQGPEHAAGLRELERMDEESYAKRQELADGYAQKLRANDLQTTEERRANYARDIALVAATYDHESALGQEDLSAKLGFLRQAALDENLSLQQRRSYQEQFYSQAKQGEQAVFDAMKAAGQVSLRDEVSRLASLASSYAANSAARIAAEKEWASAALSLRKEVAGVGKTLIEQAIGELEKEGNKYISLGQIEQKVAEMRQKAVQALSSGGTGEEVRNALALSSAFEQLTKTGASAGDAIQGGLDEARNALSGTRESVSGVTTALGALDAAAEPVFSKMTAAQENAAKGWDAAQHAIQVTRDAEGNVVSATNEVGFSFDKVKDAALGAEPAMQKLGDSGTGLGGDFKEGAKFALGAIALISDAADRSTHAFDGFSTRVPNAMRDGLSSALSLVDPFVEAINAKLASGTSTITGIGDSAATIGEAFQQGSQAAVAGLSQIKDAAGSTGPAVTSIGESARAIGDAFQQGTQAAVARLAEVKDAALGIGPALVSVADSARTIGDGFQQGSQTAITSLAQVKDAAVRTGPAVMTLGDSARTLWDGFQQGSQVAVTSLAQVKDAALGIGPTVTSISDSARTIGDGFQQGGQAAVTAIAQIGTAAEQATRAFDGFRTTIPQAMTDAFGQGQTLFATFLSNLESMAAQGLSGIANATVENFMTQLRLALDAAARAS